MSWKLVGPKSLTNTQGLTPLAFGAALLTLLLMHHERAWAADGEDDHRLRRQRDALAAAAMQQEIALLRWFRGSVCPKLSAQAEQTNGRQGV
jgi:hypothetical protein